MQVTIHYLAQLRRAAGRSAERIEVPAHCTVAALVRHLGNMHPEPLCNLLVDPEGRPQRSLLIFIRDQPAEPTSVLHDGDAVTILTPMAGG
jgi:molybdopterin converting factor small subunit